MAKKNGPSASQAIRDYCDAHPEAKNKEVSDAMQAMGFSKVSPNYVSTIRSIAKSKAKKGGAKRKPGRPPKASAPATTKSGGEVTFDSLLQAKELAAKLGGIAQAQAALEALAKLGA